MLVMLLRFTLSITLVGLPLTGHSEDWPMWRGARMDGTSLDKGFPQSADGTQNWSVEVPGAGHASPIVLGERIFLTSCLPDTEERVLQCFNRDDGKLLWQSVVLKSALEGKHRLNSHASSTPATDGERVFTAF